jgi:NosR/NirI family transcriptional regulator, nitrous oxide reductase regulator
MSNYLGKLQQLLCLLTCVLMVVAVSIRRDGKVVGRNVKNQQTVSQKADPMVVLDDGSALLNTSEFGKDIVGYGGNVPH